MFTSFKRVIKFGWQGFTRNKGLGFQVIFIMTVAVFLITFLFLFQGLSDFVITQAQKKVDISVYFRRETSEGEILGVEKELYKFSGEVESVDYISKSEAQELFVQKHQGDPLYLQALEEVGENPFLASLNIKAKNPSQYAKISEFLTEGPFKNLIQKVSYYENKKIIEKLFALTSSIKTGTIILSLILAGLVILITFNTIKLTIFSSKEEISTMKLVGASSWFIRGPFLVQSIVYGVLAVFITNLIFATGLTFLNPKLQNWLLDFNLLVFFQENFLFLLGIQFAFAFGLGIASFFLAVRKYLKI